MISEKVSKALKKRMKAMREKMECPECGCKIPVYPGRYPKECPECGSKFITDAKKENQEKLTPWQQYIQYNAIKEAKEFKVDKFDIEDVMIIAKKLGKKVTDDQAIKIMQKVYQKLGRYGKDYDKEIENQLKMMK